MSRRAPNPAAERAAQNQATIKSLLKLEANKVCSDCKRNKHPRWASWNLGVFICIRCSGIHRGMGTHISRVKSVDLDSWTDEQLQSVLSWGNARANKYWEAKLAPGHAPSEAKIENFIRTKYELKRWVMDGPMPDPATLDADGDDDVPLSIVKEKQVIERKESIRKASLGNSQAPKSVPAPQGDLIGGDPVPVRPSSAAPHAAKVAPKAEPAPPRATSTKDSLLGLDFFGEPAAPPRPASTTGTAPSGQSRPDLKQSILSLYATAPKPQPHAQPQQQSSVGGFGGLASPTFSHQSQGSVGGFNDAFSSLSISNPPKPAAPDPFASLSSASRTTSSTNAFGGLGGGSFFNSKPSQPAAPTHQQQSSNFSNFGGFSSPPPAASAAHAAPKPAQSSAMGDLFDLSAPVTTSPPPPQPAAASTNSVFNLSSPQSPPAAAPTSTTTTANAAGSMGGFSGADVWGGSDWGAPAAPAPAPVQKAPEPPKPAASDFGWSNTGGAFANTPIVPGASGGFNPIASPKVSADEEFGGWTSSGPAANGSGGQAKPSPPPKPLEQPGEEADEGSSNEAVVKEGKGDQRPTEGRGEEEETCSSGGSATGEGVFGSAEERLQLVRTQISKKLESVRQRAASAYAERKELERSRRRAVESVNAASTKHRDLEKDLELACEAEDFERAERVSENLMTVEEEKAKLLLSLREAEADCELAELKMQEVLELQIAVEEECIDLLEQFAKDAADCAESILKNAEETSCKEIEEWQSSVELLEVKKLEMDIELQLISEAHSGLENAIEDLVKNDREEKEMLARKGVILEKELDELLELVRLKEAEIAENKSQIQDVDNRISNVASKFHETQSIIDMKHKTLQEAFLKVESEDGALLIRKEEIDEVISSAEKKRRKLIELSAIASNEAKTCQDLLQLKKQLASFILKSREDRVRYSKTEEKISEDIQILRQEISAARTALQELSSTRASIQQEVTLYKQRIGFIEKRGPELEAEKKVAAAARNFREAGRVAAEAKSLHIEKEDLQHKKEKAVLHLEKLEEEIGSNVERIQKNEELVLLKEKEAALAGCNRLQLVAAAARAERSVALKMGDLEEGSLLLKEAEALESKVMELQKVYNLDTEMDEKILVSLAFITNLVGDHLSEAGQVASFNLNAIVGSQS